MLPIGRPTGVGLPLTIDRDLHFIGFSLRFMDWVQEDIPLMCSLVGGNEVEIIDGITKRLTF